MNCLRKKRRNNVQLMVSLISCIVSIMPACVHTPVRHPMKSYTDTLWFIPPFPLEEEKRDMIRYMTVRYVPIDSSFQFIERKWDYISHRIQQEFGTIRIGNNQYHDYSFHYFMMKIDSLQYDLMTFSTVSNEALPFGIYQSQYINMHDRYAHGFSHYPPWGPSILYFSPRLRFIEDKKSTNTRKEVRHYHIFYGQDIEIGVDPYGNDSLYFYFDTRMHLKKVIRSDNSIEYSTLEDMDFK